MVAAHAGDPSFAQKVDDLHGKQAIADQIARADDCRAAQTLGLRKGVVQGVDVSMNVGDDGEAHDYTMADLHSVRGRLTRCLGAGGRLIEQMECHEIVGNADGFNSGEVLVSRVSRSGAKQWYHWHR